MTAYRLMLHSGVSALSYPENKPIILESSMHVFFQVKVQLAYVQGDTKNILGF